MWADELDELHSVRADAKAEPRSYDRGSRCTTEAMQGVGVARR